jgi:hypothetical protein
MRAEGKKGQHTIQIFLCIRLISAAVAQSVKRLSYGLHDRWVGVLAPVGSGMLTSPYLPDRLWGPPSLVFNGYCGSFSRIKWQGLEGDHSPRTSVEVKKTWFYTSTPHTPSWRTPVVAISTELPQLFLLSALVSVYVYTQYILVADSLMFIKAI